MRCSQCGNQLANEAVFCNKCGTKNEAKQGQPSFASNAAATPMHEHPAKKGKWRLLLAIPAIALVAGLSVFIISNLDLFRNSYDDSRTGVNFITPNIFDNFTFPSGGSANEAGTENNLSAQERTVVLTPANSTATINVGAGANGRVSITVSGGDAWVESSNSYNGDPTLYSNALDENWQNMVADDEGEYLNWRYFFSDGETFYAGTFRDTALTYTVTATFVTEVYVESTEIYTEWVFVENQVYVPSTWTQYLNPWGTSFGNTGFAENTILITDRFSPLMILRLFADATEDHDFLFNDGYWGSMLETVDSIVWVNEFAVLTFVHGGNRNHFTDHEDIITAVARTLTAVNLYRSDDDDGLSEKILGRWLVSDPLVDCHWFSGGEILEFFANGHGAEWTDGHMAVFEWFIFNGQLITIYPEANVFEGFYLHADLFDGEHLYLFFAAGPPHVLIRQ